MKPNSLSKNGLSMTQAQTISNLCNQRAVELESQLSANNYSKQFSHEGKMYLLQEAKPLDENVFAYLEQIGNLRACQAFLMENINAKDEMLKTTFESSLEYPSFTEVLPQMKKFPRLEIADEKWGWEQLTWNEIQEFLEVEAKASVIGKFIHKKGILDNLRSELNKGIPTIDFIEMEKDKKVPVIIKVHHNSKDLLSLHETLAKEHRVYEQRVNYYKSKVKNLVTLENARRHAERQSEMSEANKEYEIAYAEYSQKQNTHFRERAVAEQAFEVEKQEAIKRISELRITVPERFQAIVNQFNEVQEG